MRAVGANSTATMSLLLTCSRMRLGTSKCSLDDQVALADVVDVRAGASRRNAAFEVGSVPRSGALGEAGDGDRDEHEQRKEGDVADAPAHRPVDDPPDQDQRPDRPGGLRQALDTRRPRATACSAWGSWVARSAASA